MFVRIGAVGLAIAALLALVFLLSPYGESEAVSPTDKLLNDRTADTYPGITQSETSIAAVGNFVVVGWNDRGENPANCSGQGYAHSPDSGATWTDRGFIPTGAAGGVTAAGVSSDPVLGSNHLGEFFFAALANEPGGTCGASGRSFIGLWRSQDNGLNFEFVADASPGTDAGNLQDKEEMAIDTSATSPFQGRIYLCWAEIDPVLAQTHIRVSAFDNAMPVPVPVLVPQTKILASASISFLTPTSEFVQGCAVDVAPDGRVYVAWGRAPLDATLLPTPTITLNPGETGSIEIVSSGDGGANWSTPVTVGTGLVAGDPSVNCTVSRAGIDFRTPALNGNIRDAPIPTLAISPDGQVNLAVTAGVFDAGSGAYLGETEYTRSTNNGVNWSPLITIQSDTTNDQFQPRLTVHSDGTIAAIWYDRAHDPSNLRIHVREGVSIDNGSTWHDFQVTDADFAPPPINPQFDSTLNKCYMGDYNAIVAHGSWYFVAWGDNRLDTSIYTPGPEPSPDHPDPDIRFEAQVAADLDGDGQPTATDNCPVTATVWFVNPGDTDCDGFADTITYTQRASETFVGTDPNDSCADTTTPNDERGPAFGEPLSPWVTDTNDNGITTLGDILAVSPFFNSPNPNPNYWARFDWNGDGKVTLSDILAVSPFFNKVCVP